MEEDFPIFFKGKLTLASIRILENSNQHLGSIKSKIRNIQCSMLLGHILSKSRSLIIIKDNLTIEHFDY